LTLHLEEPAVSIGVSVIDTMPEMMTAVVMVTANL
jgi:hypothetical protein